MKDREACCATVHGVSKGRTRLSDWTTITKMSCFPRVLNPSFSLSLFPVFSVSRLEAQTVCQTWWEQCHSRKYISPYRWNDWEDQGVWACQVGKDDSLAGNNAALSSSRSGRLRLFFSYSATSYHLIVTFLFSQIQNRNHSIYFIHSSSYKQKMLGIVKMKVQI